MAHPYFQLPKQRNPQLLKITSALLIAGFVMSSCATSSGGVATQSYEQQLAEHLTAQDVTMYGAFWCPHCAEQKEMFGDAVEGITYVECDPEGENPQPQLCKDKNIQGYPTWEINGELYPGTQSLDELARLSGFEEQ